MDRLERLVNLVAALIEAERPLSRETIYQRVGGYAADVEAFRRNFERDKDLLRQMGLPLVLEPLDRDRPEGPAGYRIPRERYELADPGLDPDELAALHLAASAVSVDAGWSRDAATTALRKLAATTGLGGAGSAEAPALRAGHSTDLPTDERVATAFGAISERQVVRFSYRGTQRRLDPWHLSFRRGQWYLSGRDHDRDSERMFRLDRVEGALETEGGSGAFVRPSGGAARIPPPWRLGEDEEVVAQLWVDAVQADWVAAELGPDAVMRRHDDGTGVFSVAVRNLDAFRSFVLGLLDHAEILGPPPVRAEMTRWLEGIAGQ